MTKRELIDFIIEHSKMEIYIYEKGTEYKGVPCKEKGITFKHFGRACYCTKPTN